LSYAGTVIDFITSRWVHQVPADGHEDIYQSLDKNSVSTYRILQQLLHELTPVRDELHKRLRNPIEKDGEWESVT